METDWHAEVGDEGGLGQLHIEEDFLGEVCFVQSFGGHDSVGETRRDSAVHLHTVHLHLRQTDREEEKHYSSYEKFLITSFFLMLFQIESFFLQLGSVHSMMHWLLPKKIIPAKKNI